MSVHNLGNMISVREADVIRDVSVEDLAEQVNRLEKGHRVLSENQNKLQGQVGAFTNAQLEQKLDSRFACMEDVLKKAISSMHMEHDIISRSLEQDRSSSLDLFSTLEQVVQEKLLVNQVPADVNTRLKQVEGVVQALGIEQAGGIGECWRGGGALSMENTMLCEKMLKAVCAAATKCLGDEIALIRDHISELWMKMEDLQRHSQPANSPIFRPASTY